MLFSLFFGLSCLAFAQANFPLPKVAQQTKVRKEERGKKQEATKNQENRKPSETESSPNEKGSHATGLHQLDDYHLELKAHAGNAEAQYLMGLRKIARNDSVNEVLGINWMRASQSKGYLKARNFLRNYRRKW